MRISDWSSDVCSSDLRFGHRGWEYVKYEPPQVEFAQLHRRRRLRGMQVEAYARLEQVDQDEADGQRYEAGDQEPGHSAKADAAKTRAVSAMGDAIDQCREHEWRDDHLDEMEKNFRRQVEHRRGIFCRFAVRSRPRPQGQPRDDGQPYRCEDLTGHRSEEDKYNLQSLMRISYAVFCLEKKKK